MLTYVDIFFIKEFTMKNKIFLCGMLIAIVGLVVSLSGCFAVPASLTTFAEINQQNLGTFGESASIPIKDFESKGLIFTEAKFTMEDGKIDGDTFTYQALLQKAKAAGADAIINIAIDKRVENVKQAGKLSKIIKQETWYGSALAIKYTNALTTGEATQVNHGRTYNLSSGVSGTSVQQ
jgi:hypothetical protein